ncbi:cupin domain-containing protein [Kineococcus sp. LSe6-4]|uniref:Cupin domain-containing protein n=1 Tax=Kineococcus halophytocola TaxID=3234027 RepID=A0ABV4H3Y5_9ACTN
MKVRRVVAGNDASGRSVFLSDDAVPHSHEYQHLPGQAHARIWFSGGVPSTTPPEGEPTTDEGPLFPAAGGSSFVIVQYAPDSVAFQPGFDGAAAGGEFAAKLPDLAAAMEPDSPGMHRTQSLDLGVVLDGEIWLELDGGAETLLRRGDTIVQLAGRHAWRNKSDQPATVAFVLTGVSDPAGS